MAGQAGGRDPQVSDLQVAAYTIPTEHPEADGTLTWDSTTMVVVHATGGGRQGTGWTYAPAAAAQVVSGKLAGQVVGRPVGDVHGSWQAMVDSVRNAGRPGLAGAAISAVDVALWDLWARVLELPVVRLLGQVRDRVPVYGSGGFVNEDEAQLRAEVERWVHGHGIGRVKLKIGQSWGSRIGRDLERVEVARRTAGPDVEVFVDANGGYRVGPALRVGRALQEQGVTWFEEPVSSDDLSGLARLRAGLDLDVAAGEYAWRLADARLLCCGGPDGQPVVDCLQVDATRCGGWTEFARIAVLAQAHGLDVSAHCAPALHAPVAAATVNLRHVEWFRDHERIERLVLQGWPEVSQGVMTVPEGPGHGMELRAQDAERWRVA